MKFASRRGSRLFAAAAAIAAVALVSGCQGGLGSGDGGDGGDAAGGDGPIKLGMLAPFSGSESAFGAYMENGASLAVQEINDAGGVLDGRQLELVVEDDACDATAAVAAANKLVTAGVEVSVGGYCSGATLPTIPIFDEAGIVMVIPAANSTELIGQRPGVFMINGTGIQQAQAAVAYAQKIGAQNIAVIDDATSYSADLATVFSEQAGAAGLTVAVEATVTPGENDYSAVATQLASAQPDLAYFTGYYQEAGLIVRQAIDAGYTGVFMLADGSVDAQFAELAGPGYTDNVVATFTQTPDMLVGAENWIADYTELAGAAPGPYSTQSYDAVRIVAEAIDQAGSTDYDAMIAALKSLKDFDTFAGPLTFTPEGTLSSGGFVIVSVDPSTGTFVLKDDLKG